jgi:1-aminocyclopropane-1-carboxylate deaminase/D-cysteine desulfhydrase-like pyridoxal-dependent ACC family enzyme
MTSAAAPALHAAVPRLAAGVPWVGLGAWPTPIEPLGEDLWVKREDRTAPRYGGNKVRTLEAMLGRARAAGATRIWATGAYGSNHVLATAIHAAAAGLACGAIVFPQPATEPAVANARAIVATGPSS